MRHISFLSWGKKSLVLLDSDAFLFFTIISHFEDGFNETHRKEADLPVQTINNRKQSLLGEWKCQDSLVLFFRDFI